MCQLLLGFLAAQKSISPIIPPNATRLPVADDQIEHAGGLAVQWRGFRGRPRVLSSIAQAADTRAALAYVSVQAIRIAIECAPLVAVVMPKGAILANKCRHFLE